MTDSQEQRTSVLLALLDAGPGADRPAELERELALLGRIRGDLRALPDPQPDARAWERIQARLGEAGRRMPVQPGSQRPESVRRTDRWLTLRVAAGVLVCVTLGLVAVSLTDRRPAAGPSMSADTTTERELTSLYQRSRRLESLLVDGRGLRRDAAERALMYRIADLDTQLGAFDGAGAEGRAERARLWGQRVAVLESLAEVRRARAEMRGDRAEVRDRANVRGNRPEMRRAGGEMLGPGAAVRPAVMVY